MSRLYHILNTLVTKVLNLESDSGTNAAYGNYCKYRKIGKWVYVYGVSANGISLPAGAYKDLTTLPSGYRPSIVHYFNVSAMGGTQQIFGEIDTNGLVRLYSTGTTAYWEYATVFPIA